MPYDLLFFFIENKLQSQATQVWLRNSLANDYWEFAQSDLDLTVWVEGGMEQAAKTWLEIIPLRKLLVGGEVHVFASAVVAKYLPYANPLELARDPRLAVRLSFDRLPTRAEKVAYLVKSIQSDKKLAILPSIRQRKWRWILAQLGLELPVRELTREVLIREVLKPLAPWLAAFSVEDIVCVLGSTDNPADLRTLEAMLKPNQEAWFDQRVARDTRLLEQLDEEFHEYLAAMVSWEIWGISPLVQLTCGLTLLQLTQHSQNQVRLIEHLKISPARRHFLVEGFKQLLADYELIRDRF